MKQVPVLKESPAFIERTRERTLREEKPVSTSGCVYHGADHDYFAIVLELLFQCSINIIHVRSGPGQFLSLDITRGTLDLELLDNLCIFV